MKKGRKTRLSELSKKLARRAMHRADHFQLPAVNVDHLPDRILFAEQALYDISADHRYRRAMAVSQTP